MDKQGLEKLNERMLEFAGFELLGKPAWIARGGEDIPVWVKPTNQGACTNPPIFPDDLTACFHPEWGIVRKFRWFMLSGGVMGNLFSAEVRMYDDIGTKFTRGWADAETPALALCLAVRDLLDKEGK